MKTVLRLAPRAREPRVDLDVIAALEAALGPDLCAEVLEDGLCVAVDRLAAVEKALAEDDFTRMARCARELSRVADRIGLPSLASQADALEECCAALDRVAAHAVAGRLLRTGEIALSACMSRRGG